MKKYILIGLLFSGLLLINSCLDNADPVAVSAHPDGWQDQSSANFHGKVVLSESLSLESCKSCHGDDYKGGTSQSSCYQSQCHAIYPHPDGFADSSSVNFHEDMMAMINWDISTCQPCHGTDFKGNGDRAKNCTVCHTSEGGPAACNTCHGSKTDPAPPEDLEGNTSTTVVTVGAHQQHVKGTVWSTFSNNKCSTCHKTPSSFDSEGHLDDTPHAEVMFSSLASNSETPANWDRNSATCSNVYCHGAFTLKKSDSNYQWAYADSVISGNYDKMYWTGINNGQALCGSCHGLPPKGHVAMNNCSGCHYRVVDENLHIINKYLHINGKADVF